MDSLQIVELKKTLNNWIPAHISIKKEEQDDIDYIHISLEKATFEQRQTIDDYVSDHVLFLHGTAFNEDHGQETQLPSLRYEIPLDGIDHIQIAESKLTFTTDRGNYTITNA
ncbi:hypothetical protein A374_08589 [Fictibacillus macauensis ZFHKF-1]|uniref:Uncharacterized protein n=1 Tax=Fictibacillus macauensis ZFHKF-1 TaxID=1196324 RepID=I8AK03_9BACL|nr:hypothetical protein [Fictibacillus macauensis]EIT85879.1 hypothetical protein A374_08589 [Fictibacillus macauensis ZFHKF-1]